MTKVSPTHILLFILFLILAGPPATAQDSLEVGQSRPQSETLRLSKMAHELVVYGQRNEDPYAMIAAARMVMKLRIGAAGTDRVQAPEPLAGAEMGRSGFVPVALEVSAILDEAARYSRRNSPAAAVITDLRRQARSGARGYAGGKGFVKMHSTIPANGEREFSWVFEGNAPAEILFVGDSDSNIDVYVYDTASGKLVGQDESLESGAFFSWTPASTKEYTFRVVNTGNYDNTTQIVSN